ncbi:hypothetical protein [Gilliamella apis]|nr:hypothetical protein [Gilliamella apis]
MRLAWQTGMFAKESKDRTKAEGSHAVTTCVVAAGDCKEGWRQPS